VKRIDPDAAAREPALAPLREALHLGGDAL
jgi:hypothetical protein